MKLANSVERGLAEDDRPGFAQLRRDERVVWRNGLPSPTNDSDPAVVGMSAVSMLSLRSTGMPNSRIRLVATPPLVVDGSRFRERIRD